MLVAAATTACTDDGGTGSTSAGTTVDDVTVAATPTSTSETPAPPTGSTESTSAGTTSGTDATVVSSTVAIVAVPDDVVPGIDSDNPFCRAWSEFAGSFQTLAGAGSAADVLEVAASTVVSSAARTIAEEFPEPIASERDVFVNDVIGPFARRAERAGEALRDAGLSDAQIEVLGELWLRALTDAGVDGAEIDVAVPDDLVDAVAAAVEAVALPAIAVDPSLVTQASTPATFEFLAGNCPDQGILAGNDAVD